MAAKKPNRQQLRKKQAARVARASEIARRRQLRQQRVKVGGIVAVLAAVGILGAFLVRGGDSSTDLAAGPDTTDLPPEEEPQPASVAGKPCVPVVGELPPGAPTVPVKLGAPPTSLVAEDLKPGTGAVVAAGQNLKVHYVGVSCSTGAIFDASYARNEPADFQLGPGLIEGWREGIPGMKVGGQRLLGIPPELAYGAEGRPPEIAPGETLWFVVEVLEAKAA